MGSSLQGNWSGQIGGWRSDEQHESPLRAAIRAVATPWNLMTVAAIGFGCLAFLSWTGVGPGSWQTRICADYQFGSAACAAVYPIKDQSRLPQASAAGVAR